MFRVDAEQTSAKRIYNLGRQTLLLSDKRCISVNAEHFLAVRQNCVYQARVLPHTMQYGMREYALVRS
jgi:hypothetical protein